MFQTLTHARASETAEPPDDLPDRPQRTRCSTRAGRRWRSSSSGFAGDPTNWWVPNHACVEAMLRSAGLEVVERPGHEIYLCRPRGLPDDVAAELASATGR